MSEFRLIPCNPSLLRQLARIKRERRREETAKAIVNGIFVAIFTVSAGVIGIVFACAFSGSY